MTHSPQNNITLLGIINLALLVESSYLLEREREREYFLCTIKNQNSSTKTVFCFCLMLVYCL
jgi:hypothetical protein